MAEIYGNRHYLHGYSGFCHDADLPYRKHLVHGDLLRNHRSGSQCAGLHAGRYSGRVCHLVPDAALVPLLW